MTTANTNPLETELTSQPEEMTDLEVRQALSMLLDKLGLTLVRTAGDPELRVKDTP